MTPMCNQPPTPSRYPLIATLALTLALVTPAEAYTYMIEISWVMFYGHDKAADINPNTSSDPTWLTVYDGALYFAAHDDEHGRELWRWDGTTASLVADVQPGSGWSSPHLLIVYDGALYFRADVGSGSDLWRYDGNTASFAADLSNFCCLYWGGPRRYTTGRSISATIRPGSARISADSTALRCRQPPTSRRSRAESLWAG